MPKVNYVAFLQSAYDAILKRTGRAPDGIIVHPDDLQAVLASLEQLPFDMPVIEDTMVSPGRVSMFITPPSTTN